MGLLSFCYRESLKFGKCSSEYRHCAVRLKTFGAFTLQPGTRLAPSILGKEMASKTSSVIKANYGTGKHLNTWIIAKLLLVVDVLMLQVFILCSTMCDLSWITAIPALFRETLMYITTTMFPIPFHTYIKLSNISIS